MTDIFQAFTRDLIDLELGWTFERERSGVHHAAADARHHLAHALVNLDAPYEQLGDGPRVLAREAYLSVIALGQIVEHASGLRWAMPDALARAAAGVERVLDALAPYVSRADLGLRRTLLDGVPIETVVAEMRREE